MFVFYLLIFLMWTNHSDLDWRDFPSTFFSSSSLGGWATTAVMCDCGGAKKQLRQRLPCRTHAHAQKLTFVQFFPAKGRWREVHLHNAVSHMAVNHDCSLRAAAKNASSKGLACLPMLNRGLVWFRGQTAEKQQHYVVMLFVRMSERGRINASLLDWLQN